MCCNSKGNVLVNEAEYIEGNNCYGQEVQFYDSLGTIWKTLSPPQCVHRNTCVILAWIANRQRILMSCPDCKVITCTLYDHNNRKTHHVVAWMGTVHGDPRPGLMIVGGDCELFVVDRQDIATQDGERSEPTRTQKKRLFGKLHGKKSGSPGGSPTRSLIAGATQLLAIDPPQRSVQDVIMFNTGTTQFSLKKTINVGMQTKYMCYDRFNLASGVIYTTDSDRGYRVHATNVESGELLWSLGGRDNQGNRVPVAGTEWQPDGICTDHHGHLYIADSGATTRCVPRIVIVSVTDGEVLQTYRPSASLFSKWDQLLDIHWKSPFFIVRKENQKASKPNGCFTIIMFQVDEHNQLDTVAHQRESILI